ncbi:hypothetical protein [Pseudoduganella rhizocola]|uniref:hypothetical protein n=1 Tax=Pseudoduganella rhizocola TaxID=3382643 RepID=UPI0038B49B91
MGNLTAFRARLNTARGIQFAYIVTSLLANILGSVLNTGNEGGPLFGPADMAYMLFDNFFMYLWYRTDAIERGIHRPRVLNILVIVLGFLTILYYVLWWDKARSKGRVLLKFAIIVLLHVVAFVLGIFLSDMLFPQEAGAGW